jgi:hypothetical protein
MHGTNSFRIIDAQQARNINSYKNVQLKLRKANAAILTIVSNKICREKNLTPKSIHIKVNANNAKKDN